MPPEQEARRLAAIIRHEATDAETVVKAVRRRIEEVARFLTTVEKASHPQIEVSSLLTNRQRAQTRSGLLGPL